MTSTSPEHLAKLIRHARRSVALTGGGINASSGIPDFYAAIDDSRPNDPPFMASLDAFKRDPQPFYRWFGPLVTALFHAQPNPAHYALAELERRGKLQAVITQNIDGLHQGAGSRTVFELHGHLRTATCTQCGRQTASRDHCAVARRGNVPRCDCGGAIKPDIFMFDEALLGETWQYAVAAVECCDLLLVAGLGPKVCPLHSLIAMALQRKASLVIVDQRPSQLDARADVVLHGDIAEALAHVVKLVLEQ